MDAPVSHMPAVQLRRHPRVKVSAPFPCSFARVGLKKWLAAERDGLGIVYDLSPKGARVMTQAAIHPGDRIAISLHLPNQASPMFVDLAIVRWGKDQTFGVEFDQCSHVADMRLRKYLQQASRHALPSAS